MFDALTSGEALSFSGVGVLVAVVLIGVMRLLLPRSDHGKLRAPIGFLVAHLFFVLLTAFSAPDGGAWKTFRVAAVLLLLISIGRAGFLILVDSVLVRRLSRPIPKIFRDICEGLVYSAAVLVTLRQAGAQLDALLTTSALLTAVIGLSLQDTLGNLFAGLSIQAQNPFAVGDWIQYGDDPTAVGRVIEINWRATKVITLDDVEVIIPNGPLARTPIRNFTKPTPISRRSLYVVVPFKEPPHRVQSTILGALVDTAGVLADPAPSVLTADFTERGVRYWIRFYTDDFAARETTDALARERIWYALRRAGIEMAVQIHEMEIRRNDEASRQRSRAEALARRIAALRRVDMLRALEDAQLERLASYAHERPYAPGELVIREGDRGQELFIVLQGELVVFLRHDGQEVQVARLDPGSFFGEMSVMTGEPRTASVRALTQTQLLVVDKGAFEQILETAPQLAERISEVLAERQSQLDSASSKNRAPIAEQRHLEERNLLLSRIKEFFSLSN